MIERIAVPEASISDADFRSIRDLVYERFGINLTPDKKSLVAGRLRKLLEERGGITFEAYHRLVVNDTRGAELSELVNRISTNHTFFNREKEHFDYFRGTALSAAAAHAASKRSRDIRVWCAASSTGEEPYMLAMLMREHFGPAFKDWELGVLATDISEKALEGARKGIYAPDRAAGIPPELLRKYFLARPDGSVEASAAIKSDITYRRFNLINASYPFKHPFDIVFCRNVMIYFDNPTKDAVVANIAKSMRPGGYLFIGHSETLGRSTPDFEYVQPAVYRRKP
jgi:chemotaxis protein methyltransferase CheR